MAHNTKHLESLLAPFPRAKLQHGATPLEPLARLSDETGLDLWIKRDDLTTLAGGGNKVRQLEYYFGAAEATGADTILITGAVQSNYVRCAAAAAARLNMHAILQLEDRVTGMGPAYHGSGNVLLSQLMGAEHMRYPHGEDEAGADAALEARAKVLRGAGHVPYVIPLAADHPPLGALGYMRAAGEIMAQAQGIEAVVVASGSAMTHVGLLAGLRALGSTVPVHGICVRRGADQQATRVRQTGARLATLLGSAPLFGGGDVRVWDGALAPGYGRMGPAAVTAMHRMAQAEGLMLDPVYTAKAFAGLLGLARDGVFTPGQKVLFLHTGGVPALFAYGAGALGLPG